MKWLENTFKMCLLLKTGVCNLENELHFLHRGYFHANEIGRAKYSRLQLSQI